jgi:hypothetical protein
VVYSCEQGCGRHYEQHHGYYNLTDQQEVVNPRCYVICQCHEVTAMYIAEILDEATVRFRCPCCDRDTIASMPAQEEGSKVT